MANSDKKDACDKIVKIMQTEKLCRNLIFIKTNTDYKKSITSMSERMWR